MTLESTGETQEEQQSRPKAERTETRPSGQQGVRPDGGRDVTLRVKVGGTIRALKSSSFRPRLRPEPVKMAPDV